MLMMFLDYKVISEPQNFLVKIKNVPKGLKCKKNTFKLVLDKGFPKGGGPTFGKNSQIMSYFFSESVPYFSLLCTEALWIRLFLPLKALHETDVGSCHLRAD